MLQQTDIEYGQFADEFRLKLVDYKAYDIHKAQQKTEPQAELIQLMRYHLHAEF